MDHEHWGGEESYFSGYEYNGKKTKKKHTGLLAVLVAFALITGTVSLIVNVFKPRFVRHGNSLTITFGEEQTMKGAADPSKQKEDGPVSHEEDGEHTVGISHTPQSVENFPADHERAMSLQQIYEKVYPSVASISCVTANGTGTGTGIVMTEDGYVITNFHVIEDAQQVYVLLGDNDRYSAKLVGGDETTDLAVLKIQAQGLIPAEFGNSDMLRVGDAVVAIGDPLGTELRGTMTNGIVSAINRDLNLSGRQMTLIQTNAALNSGNSGGPLINCYGQVIGINTMKMSNYSHTSATVEGLGFAIPITQAKPIVDELIAQGYISGRPAIGVLGQTSDIRTQLFFHLPPGVIVTGIVEDSDAYEKGLEPDDVIVEFDGIDIASLDDLVKAKNGYSAGDAVRLTIYRHGSYYYVDIELMDQIKPDIY